MRIGIEGKDGAKEMEPPRQHRFYGAFDSVVRLRKAEGTCCSITSGANETSATMAVEGLSRTSNWLASMFAFHVVRIGQRDAAGHLSDVLWRMQ